MEPVDCSRPADQPQHNSCHQTWSWSVVQRMYVHQPIADVDRLPPPTDSRRRSMAVRDHVEPCTRERPAWIPQNIEQAASEVVVRQVWCAHAILSTWSAWLLHSAPTAGIEKGSRWYRWVPSCSNLADWRRMPGSPSLLHPSIMHAPCVESAATGNKPPDKLTQCGLPFWADCLRNISLQGKCYLNFQQSRRCINNRSVYFNMCDAYHIWQCRNLQGQMPHIQ